ncbi:MAG: hypothetical protein WKF43_08090 [Acidimicrobiales bacterium]
MGDASCRPARLLRFDETVQSMADGLYRRVGPLEDALDAYVATCDAAYVVDCRDGVAAVSEWRGNFRVQGSWTGNVGRAFVATYAVDLYMARKRSGPVSVGWPVAGRDR